MRVVHLIVLMLATLILGGCVLGRTQPSAFYVLNTGLEPVAIDTRVTGPRIAVGPVTVPAYLDRNSMFVRPANNAAATEISIREFALWSEPLDDGISRLVCEGLSRRLASSNGLAFPLHASLPPTWRLSIDITRFDGAPGQSVTLDAGWILASASGDPFAMGRFTRTMPCGPELPEMVRAQSLLVEALSETLAQEILTAEK